jgi:hypothetical protein
MFTGYIFINTANIFAVSLIPLVLMPIPNIWSLLNSVYPGVNSSFILALAFGVALKVIQPVEKQKILFMSVFSVGGFYFSANRRADLYAATVMLVIILTAAFVFKMRTLLRRQNLNAVLMLALSWAVIYYARPTSGVQAKLLKQISTSNVLLAEAGEIKANLAAGVIETGSIGERIRKVITAPVYYWLDWVYPSDFGSPSANALFTAVSVVACVFLVLLVCDLRFWRNLDLIQQIIVWTLVGASIMLPLVARSSQIRLRWVQTLILPIVVLLLQFAVPAINRARGILVVVKILFVLHAVMSMQGLFSSSIISDVRAQSVLGIAYCICLIIMYMSLKGLKRINVG